MMPAERKEWVNEASSMREDRESNIRETNSLNPKCRRFLTSKKMENLLQTITTAGFSKERATLALVYNSGDVQKSIDWLLGLDKGEQMAMNYPKDGLMIDIKQETERALSFQKKWHVPLEQIEEAIIVSDGDLEKAEKLLQRKTKVESGEMTSRAVQQGVEATGRQEAVLVAPPVSVAGHQQASTTITPSAVHLSKQPAAAPVPSASESVLIASSGTQSSRGSGAAHGSAAVLATATKTFTVETSAINAGNTRKPGNFETILEEPAAEQSFDPYFGQGAFDTSAGAGIHGAPARAGAEQRASAAQAAGGRQDPSRLKNGPRQVRAQMQPSRAPFQPSFHQGGHTLNYVQGHGMGGSMQPPLQFVPPKQIPESSGGMRMSEGLGARDLYNSYRYEVESMQRQSTAVSSSHAHAHAHAHHQAQAYPLPYGLQSNHFAPSAEAQMSHATGRMPANWVDPHRQMVPPDQSAGVWQDSRMPPLPPGNHTQLHSHAFQQYNPGQSGLGQETGAGGVLRRGPPVSHQTSNTANMAQGLAQGASVGYGAPGWDQGGGNRAGARWEASGQQRGMGQVQGQAPRPIIHRVMDSIASGMEERRMDPSRPAGVGTGGGGAVRFEAGLLGGGAMGDRPGEASGLGPDWSHMAGPGGGAEPGRIGKAQNGKEWGNPFAGRDLFPR